MSFAGYLFPFFAIFLIAASPRSIPQTSASLIRYSNTSDSSSPRCSLSDSFQFGRPLSTSPLHWNISDSSPTSPIYKHIDRLYINLKPTLIYKLMRRRCNGKGIIPWQGVNFEDCDTSPSLLLWQTRQAYVIDHSGQRRHGSFQ